MLRDIDMSDPRYYSSWDLTSSYTIMLVYVDPLSSMAEEKHSTC